MTPLRNTAENATAGVPVVRGLVWSGDRAETVFGRYLVGLDPWSAGELFEMRGPDCGDSDTLATADGLPTVEAAQAAAQTHFEQLGLAIVNPDFLSELDTARAEIERLRGLADRLTLEAQAHASEARTANSTIYEIYQVLSGSTGEPGNWNGAEPARQFVTAAQARTADLERDRRKVHELSASLRDRSTWNLPVQESAQEIVLLSSPLPNPNAEAANSPLTPMQENDRG